MNAKHTILPDTIPVATELTLGDSWDSAAIASLIRSKCNLAQSPAFLFLGRSEATLLRGHLAAAFGREAVATLNATYYMGLRVIELAVPSFVRTAGRKTIRTLQDPIARRPAWRDQDTDSLWQFRLRP
jgi:hypothetical protein